MIVIVEIFRFNFHAKTGETLTIFGGSKFNFSNLLFANFSRVFLFALQFTLSSVAG